MRLLKDCMTLDSNRLARLIRWTAYSHSWHLRHSACCLHTS